MLSQRVEYLIARRDIIVRHHVPRSSSSSCRRRVMRRVMRTLRRASLSLMRSAAGVLQVEVRIIALHMHGQVLELPAALRRIMLVWFQRLFPALELHRRTGHMVLEEELIDFAHEFGTT